MQGKAVIRLKPVLLIVANREKQLSLNMARQIDRIAAKKGADYVEKLKKPYRELIEKTQLIIAKARQMCIEMLLPQAAASDVFGPDTLQAFIARTERVIDTTSRCVLLGESVPNNDKLFSMFEPHT